MDRKRICEVINNEMMLATGCTEPAAIALTAAYARERLAGRPVRVSVKASVNIIKNAMCAGIPNMAYTGVNYAAALGAVAGRTSALLMVIDEASPEQAEEAAALVHGGNVTVDAVENVDKLYIEAELEDEAGHTSTAIIAGAHTNLIYLAADGEVYTDRRAEQPKAEQPREKISLTLREVYDFAGELDPERDDLHMIREAIEINSRIAKVGSEGDFGLNVGRHLGTAQAKGLMSGPIEEAVRLTAHGADARMAGADEPVVTNSGSGNQGITATVPIISAAKSFGIDEDKMFRAVTLSHLVAIYIHANFGVLSGLCGATVAATGAAAGITYMLGGTYEQVGFAINNMLGDLSGMLCDGAKADCALKISTCVWTAFLCAWMALNDTSVKPDEGIVEQDPEHTIRNFNRLGNEGSPAMDKLIMDILVNKAQRK